MEFLIVTSPRSVLTQAGGKQLRYSWPTMEFYHLEQLTTPRATIVAIFGRAKYALDVDDYDLGCLVPDAQTLEQLRTMLEKGARDEIKTFWTIPNAQVDIFRPVLFEPHTDTFLARRAE